MAVPQGWEWKGLDRMPLTAEGLQLSFHRVGPEAGLNKPNPLRVPQWSHVGEHRPTCAGPRPMLLTDHPSLWCSH